MANGKKSFLVYCDSIHTFNCLSNEEAGIVIKWLLDYTNDLNPEPIKGLLGAVVEPLKQQLKRDLKKYEGIIERNSINGKKGGRPKTQINPKKAVGFSENPNEPKKADTDTDTDKDTVKEKDIKEQSKKIVQAEKKDFISEIVSVWCEVYEKTRGEEYTLTTLGKEKAAAGKIAQLNKKKFPEANSNEAIEKIKTMFEICLSIKSDQWLYSNMSMTTIVSKYNQIKTILNDKNKPANQNRPGATKEGIEEVFKKHFAE